jgi:hypothetical protein
MQGYNLSRWWLRTAVYCHGGSGNNGGESVRKLRKEGTPNLI